MEMALYAFSKEKVTKFKTHLFGEMRNIKTMTSQFEIHGSFISVKAHFQNELPHYALKAVAF